MSIRAVGPHDHAPYGVQDAVQKHDWSAKFSTRQSDLISPKTLISFVPREMEWISRYSSPFPSEEAPYTLQGV